MTSPNVLKDELLTLKNVGAATRADLALLGIENKAQLAQQEPDQMYSRLITITGKSQDPCVWDVFAAVVHEARTGEKQPWWHWTPERKRRQAENKFCI